MPSVLFACCSPQFLIIQRTNLGLWHSVMPIKQIHCTGDSCFKVKGIHIQNQKNPVNQHFIVLYVLGIPVSCCSHEMTYMFKLAIQAKYLSEFTQKSLKKPSQIPDQAVSFFSYDTMHFSSKAFNIMVICIIAQMINFMRTGSSSFLVTAAYSKIKFSLF